MIIKDVQLNSLGKKYTNKLDKGKGNKESNGNNYIK